MAEEDGSDLGSGLPAEWYAFDVNGDELAYGWGNGVEGDNRGIVFEMYWIISGATSLVAGGYDSIGAFQFDDLRFKTDPSNRSGAKHSRPFRYGLRRAGRVPPQATAPDFKHLMFYPRRSASIRPCMTQAEKIETNTSAIDTTKACYGAESVEFNSWISLSLGKQMGFHIQTYQNIFYSAFLLLHDLGLGLGLGLGQGSPKDMLPSTKIISLSYY